VHSELTVALSKRLAKDKIAAPSSQSEVKLVHVDVGVDVGVVTKLCAATSEAT
jgi:hypothetical protein